MRLKQYRLGGIKIYLYIIILKSIFIDMIIVNVVQYCMAKYPIFNTKYIKPWRDIENAKFDQKAKNHAQGLVY